jgi:hypothetical protein
MIGAGVKGNKALAKQAAVNAAALGASAAVGYGVSKAAGAIPKVVESGIIPRVTNKITRQSILVHGTNKPIVGNKLIPYAGSVESPNVAVVYAVNPNNKTGLNQAFETTSSYARTWEKPQTGISKIVIGKTKTKNMINTYNKEFLAANNSEPKPPLYPLLRPLKENIVVTKTPIPIKKVLTFGDSTYQLNEKNLIAELRKAGVKTNYPKNKGR